MTPDRRQRAEWVARHRAPVVPGLRAIHASWIEHALDGLPARAREVLATGATSPIDVWLARWACADFVPMPAIDPSIDAPREPADLLVMGPLERWLAIVGRAHLAAAAQIAAGRAAAIDLGPKRAVIERCRGGDALRIGVRAVLPHVTDREIFRLRLPRELASEIAAAEPPAWSVLTSLR